MKGFSSVLILRQLKRKLIKGSPVVAEEPFKAAAVAPWPLPAIEPQSPLARDFCGEVLRLYIPFIPQAGVHFAVNENHFT